MAGLDLQKQMEEAAVERSGIAKALLGIQKSLDQIAPSVPKMEPVLASLELVVHDLTAWRPGVDAAMDQLQTDLGDIRAELEKIALHTSTGGKAVDSSTLAAADALRLGTDPSGDDHGPDGHRRAPPSRALLAEGPILPIPGPNNGTPRTPFPTIPIHPPPPLDVGNSSLVSNHTRMQHNHVDCPGFDGVNPTGWRIRCEAYFRVCGIDPQVWTLRLSISREPQRCGWNGLRCILGVLVGMPFVPLCLQVWQIRIPTVATTFCQS